MFDIPYTAYWEDDAFVGVETTLSTPIAFASSTPILLATGTATNLVGVLVGAGGLVQVATLSGLTFDESSKTLTASGSGSPGSGTVTKVEASGGTTGFAFTGSPITSSGTLTLTVADKATARAAIGAPAINDSTTGNAATATALQVARTINGTPFDGTANITITSAISNVTGLQAALDLKAPLASPTFTGTPSSTTPSTSDNSTRIATTAMVQAAIASAVTGLLELKGNLDCSANPDYPAGVVGDLYYVTVAGKIGGASGLSVDVGDAIVCKTDNAGGTQASVGSSWFILERNIVGALLASNNLSDITNAATARANLGAPAGSGNDILGNAGTATALQVARTINGVSFNGTANITITADPNAHTHGNITNTGAIGTTANLPLITTTGGVITVGSFGTSANTFCQGNDSRLSDSRTPTAHTHPLNNLDQSGATNGQVPQWNGTAWAPATVSGGGSGAVDVSIQQFRLTTESGVSISTSDRTAQSIIYLTPHVGNQIALYDGSAWQLRSTAEISLTLSGLTSGRNYDVFAFWTGSAVSLELSAAWTNDTTRAEAITRQDGVWCKSGALTRRLVGTIRTTGTTTTEDSSLRRFVANVDNRVARSIRRTPGRSDNNALTSFTITSNNTWTELNGSGNGRVEFVIPISGTPVRLALVVLADGSASQTPWAGIGVDSTTSPTTAVFGPMAGRLAAPSSYEDTMSAGYHFLAGLALKDGTGGTMTIYADIPRNGASADPESTTMIGSVMI